MRHLPHTSGGKDRNERAAIVCPVDDPVVVVALPKEINATKEVANGRMKHKKVFAHQRIGKQRNEDVKFSTASWIHNKKRHCDARKKTREQTFQPCRA